MGINIRRAVKEDAAEMMKLIKELAVYERAPDEVTVTMDHFIESGFGKSPVWWAFVAEENIPGKNKSTILGFALYYIRYSTWKGQRMYLEDITPFLQQPFRYDVDFVVHSTTKFLNGHGTAIGGILLGRDIDFMKTKVYTLAKTLGGNANPFDAFLLINGMKTLEVRMERHCQNAMEVAHYLEKHNAVAKVNYTGLASHPDYATAAKQMKHPGAMLSFELKGGLQGGIDFMDKLKMCTRTVSLGTCDTLLSHPASMTHYSVPKEEKDKYGISDGLIRMNVGIESLQDILNDLQQALK